MIRSELADGIARITLDRPAKRNALTSDGLRELRSALESAGEDARAVVLTGAGDAFCAGADIEEVRSLDAEAAESFSALGQSVAETMEELPVPVVAAIDGPCIGGGTELVLACDLRFATPHSSFGEPGVRIGIFGGWGGTTRLPRLVGAGNAMDLALTGRTVTAAEAEEMGLVNRTVPDATERALAVVREVGNYRADALDAVKTALLNGQRLPADEALERERELFGGLFDEGMGGRIDAYLDEG